MQNPIFTSLGFFSIRVYILLYSFLSRSLSKGHCHCQIFRWFCSLLKINKLPQLLNFPRGWVCKHLINKDLGPQFSILWEACVSFTAKSACQKWYLTASTALSPLRTLIFTLYSTLASIRHKVLCLRPLSYPSERPQPTTAAVETKDRKTDLAVRHVEKGFMVAAG